MRWKHPDPSDREEGAARQAALRRMDQWWEAFARHAKDIDLHFREGRSFDVPAFMAEHLTGKFPLLWEFGPGNPGHRLVLTPEMNHHLRPMVEALCGRAPKLEGWKFLTARPREGVEEAEMTVQARSGGSLRGARVSCSIGKHRQLDVSFSFPSGTADSCFNRAFVATETLLGERTLDQWVGAVKGEISKKPTWIGSLIGHSPSKQGVELAGFADFFDQVRETVQDRAVQPPWKRSEECTMFNREPSPGQVGQADLRIAATWNKEVWVAQQSGTHFHSGRFAPPPAGFLYIKMDATSAPREKEVEYRSAFEDALSAALEPSRLGGVLGGGWSPSYFYIELAVADLSACIDPIRSVLRSLKAPNRTWILFHDWEFALEWVGAWDDSPPPPSDPQGRVSGPSATGDE